MPDGPKRIQTLSSWIARDGTHYTMPDGYSGASRYILDVGFQAGASLLTLEQLEQLPTDPDALTAWMTDSYRNPSRPMVRGRIPAGRVVLGEVPADEVLNRSPTV